MDDPLPPNNRVKLKNKWFDDFEAQLPSMEGKTVVITGTTTGCGSVAADTMAKKGAKLLILNRDSTRAKNALKILLEAYPSTEIHWVMCDLQSFDSVRAAAAEVKNLCPEGIDVLCNNAGVMGSRDQPTEDGYDIQMQTNHLSHFMLTKELFPLLTNAAEVRGEARIVNHSSIMRHMIGTKLKAKYFRKNCGKLGGNYVSLPMNILVGGRLQRYHQTKLANSVFTQELKKKIEQAGVKVKALCAHPGIAVTHVVANSDVEFYSLVWRMTKRKIAQSQEDGTMPLLHCMAAEGVSSGDFYGPKSNLKGPIRLCKPGKLTNAAAGKILWEESEAACGVFSI